MSDVRLRGLYTAVLFVSFFFFNDTATTEIYTLSLHDALPICWPCSPTRSRGCPTRPGSRSSRSEEHTSELQSRLHLVCRLLLEKKQQHNHTSFLPTARRGGASGTLVCRRR